MGVGRGVGETLTPWILKLLAKTGCFLVSSVKKQILQLLPRPRKILENLLVPPLWKKSFRRPWSKPSVNHLSAIQRSQVRKRQR